MNGRRLWTTLLGIWVFAIASAARGPGAGSGVVWALADQATTTARATSRLVVTLPQVDAELVVEGSTVAGSGLLREVETSPLPTGVTHKYSVEAKWQPNTYTTMIRAKTVSFRAGERVTIDLTVDDPGDRVRVLYVPTPSDIVNEMIKLAGIGPSDVVFEPGCGDARITIAAVKAGAKRGVGVDIDADRVTESRALVKSAGLADRIEIRQGDALDIRDLSQATVVFLYMGDHFNMLIRPILWRDLKVGTRVVSHRFKMGDWKPDRTVSLGPIGFNDNPIYELHLWTVTEELKRKVRDLAPSAEKGKG
jgi:uncharacterized protein (TIGR03000 family)